MNTTTTPKTDGRTANSGTRVILFLGLAALILMLAVALYISVPQWSAVTTPAGIQADRSYDEIEHIRSSRGSYVPLNRSEMGVPAGANCSALPSKLQEARCLGVK